MPLPWAQVHRIAATEAARVFQALAIDTTQQIDPFAALAAEGVVVMRRPLDRVAGLYVPGDARRGNPPGVLINSGHPLTKQRYTAAHELGHHRRDHEVVLDEDTEWFGRGVEPALDRERIAEAFAAWFLMPRQLMQTKIQAVGLSPRLLNAEGAYTLALELGTSYAATVHHLTDTRLIPASRREELLNVAPQEIKRTLGAFDALADSWRDVRVVRPDQAGTAVRVQEGDALVVEVPETPSSGYLWETTTLPGGLTLVRDEYRAPNGDDLLGGRGTHRFLFRADGPGQREVRLDLRRPWQQRAAPTEVRHLGVAVEAKPVPGIVNPDILVNAVA